MPAARYWRVLVFKTNGGNTSCAELVMREISGGSNVATGGTASASSIDSPATSADKAFDGNTTTKWAGTTLANSWIKYDMGIGTTRDIVEITWRARDDGFENQNPSDFAVQYSTDNISWTDAWRVHHTTFTTTGEVRTFTKPGVFAPTRYWAFRMGRGDGVAQLAMGGTAMEMAESNDGLDITSSRSAERAFSTFGGSPASNLFDDNTTTAYSSLGTGDVADAVFVAVEWATVKTIEQIKWRSRPNGGFSNHLQSPTRFWVEWSPDNINYAVRWSGTSPDTWTPEETRTFPRLPTLINQATVRFNRFGFTSAGSVTVPADAQAVVRLNRLTARATARRRLPGTVITAANLVSATRRLIQDTLAPQRFTDVVLIDYMNMILSLLCIYRPDVFSKVVQVAPAADSVVQTLPPDAVRLVEVFSINNGPAITEVTRETMDQMYPQWVGEASGAPVNFMRHPRNPRSYYLYPPPVAGTVLNIEYIRALPIYGIANDIPLSQEMFSVIVAGMVFLAEVSDAEPSSFDRAKVALVQFVQDVGSSLNVRVIADTESAAVRTDGDEDVKTRK